MLGQVGCIFVGSNSISIAAMCVIYILPSTTHRPMKIDTVVGEPIHPDAA